MPDATKRGPGRPPKGKPIKPVLPPELIAWIDSQPGSRSDVTREAIEILRAARGEK